MNRQEKITSFIKEFKHPLESEILTIRDVVLEANGKITETIKWGAPTFEYKGSIATFNMRAKKFVNLTFHNGALIKDSNGILEGDAKQARVIRFKNMEEIIKKSAALQDVINYWIDLKDMDG